MKVTKQAKASPKWICHWRRTICFELHCCIRRK